MRTSAKMGLRIWNLLLDPYDHEQLADNWAKVDAHDHSEGRGVLIPTEGIAPGAITFSLLSPGLLSSGLFPEVTSTGGELEVKAPTGVKLLVNGPELIVGATGIYEVGLQLRAEGIFKQFVAIGAIMINGIAQGSLFEAYLGNEGDIAFTTNFARYELTANDKLTVGVGIVGEGEEGTCLFSRARISAWRIA